MPSHEWNAERSLCLLRSYLLGWYTHETMSLSLNDVQHVARLARMRMSDEELEHMRVQLSAILDYVALLQKLDVDGVEPTAQITGQTTVTRADQVEAALPREAALRNAPDQRDGMFRVRAVFDD